MWHRHITDPQFGHVRVATAPEPLSANASWPGRPVAVSLCAFSRVRMSGRRQDALDLTRAMLAHLVTFHHPSTVRVACCAGPGRAAEWEWLGRLPHSHGLYAETPARLAVLLEDELAARPPQITPYIVIILDEPAPSLVDSRPGVTILDVSGGRTALLTACLELVVDGERLGMRTGAGIMPVGNTDRLDRAQAEVVARRLASLNPAGFG